MMRLVRFNGNKTGLLISGSVIDIGASGVISEFLPGDGSGSWSGMIAHWDEAREPLQALEAAGGGTPLASVRLDAPLPDRRGRIIALGANVAAHAVNAFKAITGQEFTEDHFYEDKRKGMPPWGFLIMPETVVGPESEVKREASVQKLDYEVEAAIILAAGGKNMQAEDLRVWGFTAWNDLSIRDGRLGIGLELHRGAFNWAVEKNFDTGNPCGPCVVVDEDYDVNDLRCMMRVNGELRQDWRTSKMIYGFSETVAFLSKYITMAPGDIILSGTGTGTAVEGDRDGDRWLKSGDVLEAEVEGAGVLRNKVVEWAEG
jgi:2-keto-4-pentenoate hydratase/2-oxohepta-3-ene-1,7-dioic acid hydratase in catechol pathway